MSCWVRERGREGRRRHVYLTGFRRKKSSEKGRFLYLRATGIWVCVWQLVSSHTIFRMYVSETVAKRLSITIDTNYNNITPKATVLNQNCYVVIFISVTLKHYHIFLLLNLDVFKADIKWAQMVQTGSLVLVNEVAIPKSSHHSGCKGSGGNSWSIVTQLYRELNKTKMDLNPTKTFLQDIGEIPWWSGKLDSEIGYQHS